MRFSSVSNSRSWVLLTRRSGVKNVWRYQSCIMDAAKGPWIWPEGSRYCQVWSTRGMAAGVGRPGGAEKVLLLLEAERGSSTGSESRASEPRTEEAWWVRSSSSACSC